MFTKSGGSRNYFRTAIRRTEIHSVVKQSLLSFSFSLYLSISLVLSFSLLPSESFGGTNKRKRGSTRAREDPLCTQFPPLSISRRRRLVLLLLLLLSSSSSLLSSLLPSLSRPLSSTGRPSLLRGSEEIGFRFTSRNLKPPLLRLSLNATQFSARSLPLS